MYQLVFDFGAVLFEWQPAQLAAESFPDLASTPDAAAQLGQEIFGHADWLAFDRGRLTLDAVVGSTAQRLALPQARLHSLISGIGEGLRPIEATVGLLAELASRRRQHGDLRLYYLSNMPALYARALERKHSFVGWFDGGIFSGDVQCCKPDAAIYQLLQSRYALDPARTWLFDDSRDNVAAARGFGWNGFQFISPQQLRFSLGDLLGQEELRAPVLSQGIG